MLTLTSVIESSGDAARRQRAAVLFVVVAAHVALIFVLGRGTRRPAEVLEMMTFLTLPITPEEERAQASISAQNPMSTQTPAPPVRAARRLRAQQSISTPPKIPSATPLPTTTPPPTESPTSAPIDWRAEVGATAKSLEDRARAKREQRAFAGPGQSPYTRRNVKPECPFEQCEPNWGAGSNVFESQPSKKGRIEKTPDGEVIRWTSESCYQILVTPNLMHRGMSKCQVPLGKKTARGDLFKHMHEAPPPEDRATDVP